MVECYWQGEIEALGGKPVQQQKSALFWDFTQRRVVIPYRFFGKTYRSLGFLEI
jgi:hypothetical protein